MNLILDYDASCDAAPPGFEKALNQLALVFDDTFTNDTTVTIDVGFGEIDGVALAPFALGESNTTFNAVPDAASPNGLLEVPSDVGQIGFTNVPYLHYDDKTPPTVGQYDFRGIAEHEITEVMGRQLLAPQGEYTALDLMRYTFEGNVPYTGPNYGGYASADGGVTNLGDFNTNPYGDPGDWIGNTNDAFNAFSNPGVRNPMSANDLAVMNAIGWTNGGAIANDAHVAHHDAFHFHHWIV